MTTSGLDETGTGDTRAVLTVWMVYRGTWGAGAVGKRWRVRAALGGAALLLLLPTLALLAQAIHHQRDLDPGTTDELTHPVGEQTQ